MRSWIGAGGRAGGSAPIKDAVATVAPIVLVVEASMIAAALADDGPGGDRARGRLRGEQFAAPEIVDLEVVSVLRGQLRARRVDERRAVLALNDHAPSRFTVFPMSATRVGGVIGSSTPHCEHGRGDSLAGRHGVLMDNSGLDANFVSDVEHIRRPAK